MSSARKLIVGFLTFIFLSLFSPSALAAPAIEITSFPSSVVIEQSFEISVNLNNLETGAKYFLKAIGGADWYKIRTWSDKENSWLAWNASWEKMPELIAQEGENQFLLSVKFIAETPLGNNPLKARIRKEATSTNYDSETVNIEVLSSSPPTPTPTPTNTPTPTSSPTFSPPPPNWPPRPPFRRLKRLKKFLRHLFKFLKDYRY